MPEQINLKFSESCTSQLNSQFWKGFVRIYLLKKASAKDISNSSFVDYVVLRWIGIMPRIHYMFQQVFKGKKMPGRMGGKQRTVKNVWVYKIDPARNLMWVRGQVCFSNHLTFLIFLINKLHQYRRMKGMSTKSSN